MESCVLHNSYKDTRPKPAYGRQGLDWIIGPGYSFVVVTNRGLHLTFMTQLEKVIIFRYKQTFFVTNRGLHLTFMTQLEKVIIFCYK